MWKLWLQRAPYPAALYAPCELWNRARLTDRPPRAVQPVSGSDVILLPLAAWKEPPVEPVDACQGVAMPAWALIAPAKAAVEKAKASAAVSKPVVSARSGVRAKVRVLSPVRSVRCGGVLRSFGAVRNKNISAKPSVADARVAGRRYRFSPA